MPLWYGGTTTVSGVMIKGHGTSLDRVGNHRRDTRYDARGCTCIKV